MTLEEYFAANPQTANEWAAEKNRLSPAELSTCDHEQVWWRCENGHEWQARVYSVTSGTGCPYCTGKRAIPGKTDLASTHPHIARMWSNKNKLQPTEVTAGSMKKVLLVCARGHEWECNIFSVARQNTGCPYCAGKQAIPGETDLATLKPELMSEWDFDKNAGLDPAALLPSSHVKAWWKCALGHSYQAAVFSRSKENGSGCPYCSGKKVLPGFNDLATLNPAVAAQWYRPLNGELKPEDVSPGSNKKVWWQCDEGHVWQTYIYSRTRSRGSGCPVCTGRAKARRRAV